MVELVTRRLALLADPTRVQLLMQLGQGEMTVKALSEQMPSTQQNISRHLCILYREGIVARRRAGTSIYYSIADYSACRLLDHALTSISGFPIVFVGL